MWRAGGCRERDGGPGPSVGLAVSGLAPLSDTGTKSDQAGVKSTNPPPLRTKPWACIQPDGFPAKGRERREEKGGGGGGGGWRNLFDKVFDVATVEWVVEAVQPLTRATLHYHGPGF